MVSPGGLLAQFSVKLAVLRLEGSFSGENVYSLGCSIQILPCCTANKRRTRFSLKVLHFPYRFSLIRCAIRENHRFLTPFSRYQIAGPPSQHELDVLRVGCIIEISLCFTANKRRNRFSLKALHFPYRFSLIRRAIRENHGFLTPILACQIAAPPPSQHQAGPWIWLPKP